MTHEASIERWRIVMFRCPHCGKRCEGRIRVSLPNFENLVRDMLRAIVHFPGVNWDQSEMPEEQRYGPGPAVARVREYLRA